jgi:hypothetical protein
LAAWSVLGQIKTPIYKIVEFKGQITKESAGRVGDYLDPNAPKLNWIKMDTGGYTGDWGNSEGRLAMLHRKELILNPEDTENMLATIELVRNIARIIDLNAGVQSLGLGYLSASNGTDNSQVIEQQVTIHAEFPEAQDRNEIKEAFSMLINEASQFANRKNL